MVYQHRPPSVWRVFGCAIFAILFMAFMFWVALPVQAAEPITSFSKAKRYLGNIHAELNLTQTSICGCEFEGTKVNFDKCALSFAPRVTEGTKAATRIGVEWDHIVAFEDFRDGRACYVGGNRADCERNDLATADPHNLIPVVGQINLYKSSRDLGVVDSDFNYFKGSQCAVKAAKDDFEPTDQAKGAMARAALYMRERYGISYDPARMLLMQGWHEAYPPSFDEIIRAKRIYADTGMRNEWAEGLR